MSRPKRLLRKPEAAIEHGAAAAAAAAANFPNSTEFRRPKAVLARPGPGILARPLFLALPKVKADR